MGIFKREEPKDLTAEEIEKERLKMRTTNLFFQSLYYATGTLFFLTAIIKIITWK